jgi:DNA-binding transcriptional MocR family regulator
VNGTHADGTDPPAPVPIFEWQRALRQRELPASVHHVGLTLSTYANRDGSRAHPSVARLERDTGRSKRTVLRALKELRHRGLITRTFRRRQSGRLGLADEYQLTLPQRVPPQHLVTDSEQVSPEHPVTDSLPAERVPPATRTGATSDTNGCHLSTPTTPVPPLEDHSRCSTPGSASRVRAALSAPPDGEPPREDSP